MARAQPRGKGPGSAAWLAAEHEPAVAPGGQEGQGQPDQTLCGQQDQGSYCPSVLGTGGGAPQILCSVLGPSLDERP